MKNIVLLPTSNSRINRGNLTLTQPVFDIKAAPIEGDDLYVPVSQLELHNLFVDEGGVVTHKVDCIDLDKVKDLHPRWDVLGWIANSYPVEVFSKDTCQWEQVDYIDLDSEEIHRQAYYPAKARVRCERPDLILDIILGKKVMYKEHICDKEWLPVTNTLDVNKPDCVFKVEEPCKYPLLRKHLCQHLHEDYVDQLIEETDEAGCIITDSKGIGESICWHGSPQGFAFWDDLYNYMYNIFDPHDWRKHTI